MGEVMQIFVCVAAGVPVMRTPLQILFLILVTDLPPAVALGMEPGDPEIMKDRPRPKTQEIVLKWMWQSIIMNGFILSLGIIIIYIIALEHFVGYMDVDKISALVKAEREVFKTCGDNAVAKGWIEDSKSARYDFCHQNLKEKGASSDYCTKMGLTSTLCAAVQPMQEKTVQLMNARTCAFIGVVWSENIRAYTSRSFDKPFFYQMFANVAMQKAISIAQVALYFIIFILPLGGVTVRAVFKLDAIEMSQDDAYGWLLAFFGAFFCLVGCECYKFVAKAQIAQQRKEVLIQQQKDDAAVFFFKIARAG